MNRVILDIRDEGPFYMSYARARLYLGISCVGTMVVVSLLLLLFQVPKYLLSVEGGIGAEILQFALVLIAYAFLSAPFDLFGGYILPKEYGRTTAPITDFLKRWFRGVFFHSLVLLVVAVALLSAARKGGFILFLGLYLGINLALIFVQPLIGQLLGGIRYRRLKTPPVTQPLEETIPKRIRILGVTCDSTYFTGGIAGLPGFELILLPERWLDGLTQGEVEAALVRRTGVIHNGSRTRGLLLAIGWNTLGASLAFVLSGGITTVAGLVTFGLWFTLWNFFGLLLLPSPSQRGVFSGDVFALKNGVEMTTLGSLIQTLDRDQDDEPARSQGVETYFHPLPSVERRMGLLKAGGTPDIGAWHGARMAIYLSWAGFSFLSRAVHCNCGRPDVWVFLPSD